MSAMGPPTLRDRLFVAMQYLLPQHFLSRVVHRIARSETAPVKNLLISSFVRGFHPDMSEAEQPDPLRFASFNAFFTRTLRSEARPIAADTEALISPVDGTISQIGRLDGSKLIQAKGHDYTVEALLAAPSKLIASPNLAGGSESWPSRMSAVPAWTERFTGGSFATLYLAPYNYHRIHMPLAGKLRAAWFVPGRLFSVNAVTAAAVPGLFARNERVVCIFEDGPLTFALVLVGALFVGSISTVWHGDITPRSPRTRVELPLDSSRSPLHLAKAAEMGRFNMGSTVILLLPRDAAEWLPNLEAGNRIRVGQTLARLR
jgi:phosphatidylserine decarboxylase